ncbi:MAG: DUF998 domain-containing protein [Candidatus Dormibacteria bacterium]|jgi:hypothetical protein
MTANVAARERPRRRGPAVWGVIGLLAQVAFAAGWVIAETWQGPRYSPLTDTISDLQAATAPHAWFPIACFAAGGLGTFGFAVFGLRPAWRGAVRIAPWAIGLSGLALGNSFPQIPCQLSASGCTATGQLLSAGGLTDAILSGAALWLLAITPLQLARLLIPLPQWRALARLLLVAGVVAIAGYGLLALALLTGVWAGLVERALVAVCQLWLAVLAVNLIRTSGAGDG